MSEPVAKKAAVDNAPPVFSSIDTIYTTAEGSARASRLVAEFTRIHGHAPAFLARAPGRVNLIGEHIDYSGYAVLPMAIEQDIIIAVGLNSDNTLQLDNVDAKHTTRTYKSWPLEVDNTKHDWGNYFLAGYKGMVEYAKLDAPVGMACVVDGNVPSGSGLSSSSAFVVCAALATMHANKLSYDKVSLASMCAKAEHYVGTEGGGMDQSISLLAQKGTAKYIEFNPIRATDVPLPNGGAFVISNSCVEANKYVTAGSCFNKRVVECRAAAMVLAKHMGLAEPTTFRRLGAVQVEGKKTLGEMAALSHSLLHAEDYSQQEIADILGLSLQALQEQVLSPSTITQEAFNLRDRAHHVFSESERVVNFKNATSLSELGSLMSQSHASCRDEYECSCPELDELTALCVASGAYGSRLTGAGWGGCAVSLVDADKVPDFIEKIRKGYYAKDARLAAAADTNLFATLPAQGAALIDL